VDDETHAQDFLKNLKARAKAAGFRPIPPSRHQTLVIEYPIEGFGDKSDLQFRHAAEEFLDQLVGWLGLGHCDGGSSGSNSMEVFCIVVDFEIAKEAFQQELQGSRFANFSRIYRMK
jgi:hypothetical protein